MTKKTNKRKNRAPAVGDRFSVDLVCGYWMDLTVKGIEAQGGETYVAHGVDDGLIPLKYIYDADWIADYDGEKERVEEAIADAKTQQVNLYRVLYEQHSGIATEISRLLGVDIYAPQTASEKKRKAQRILTITERGSEILKAIRKLKKAAKQ